LRVVEKLSFVLQTIVPAVINSPVTGRMHKQQYGRLQVLHHSIRIAKNRETLIP
jgi:hypothetical protein